MTKKTAIRIKPWEGPVVVVLEEKHSNRYFVASTEADLHAIALHILQERLESGAWYYDPGEPPSSPEEVTAEVLRELPQPMQDAYHEQWEKHREEMHDYEEEKREYKAIVEACTENNGFRAVFLLMGRTDHQYEHIHLCTPETAPPIARPEHPQVGRIWVTPEGLRLQWLGEAHGWRPHVFAEVKDNVQMAQGVPPARVDKTPRRLYRLYR